MTPEKSHAALLMRNFGLSPQRWKGLAQQPVAKTVGALVETLAERCAAIVLDEFGVTWVRLKLSKPGAVRGSRTVGVSIERQRAG